MNMKSKTDIKSHYLTLDPYNIYVVEGTIVVLKHQLKSIVNPSRKP
jgi:hypothetical protein